MVDDAFAVSGSQECLSARSHSEEICPNPGVIYDDKILPDPHLWTATWLECQQKCNTHANCKHFTWKQDLGGSWGGHVTARHFKPPWNHDSGNNVGHSSKWWLLATTQPQLYEEAPRPSGHQWSG